jgi:aminobenzoyl-glutamate utilization protein A
MAETTNETLQRLGAEATRKLPDLISLRRTLHRHPEAGWTEFRTTGIVADRLGKLGYDVRLGAECVRPDAVLGRPPATLIEESRARAGQLGASIEVPGAVGILERGPGPTIALRFDMDATEVSESMDDRHRPRREDFAADRPNVMHACGHDAHVAIGLGVAELLAECHEWRGRLKLVFQPAEEGGRGAYPMVEAGVVDDVNYFLSLHIGGPDLHLGDLALEATHFLSSAKLDAKFRGVASHAAGAPEKGRNALLAACQAALALHALPRHSQGATFVNVGVLNAGSGRNVTAPAAEMKFEVRGETDQICQEMETSARRSIEGAALLQGVECDIELVGRTIGATSDPELKDQLASVARALPLDFRLYDAHPLGGGEDATFFMRRIQQRGGKALYFLLGANSTSGHHSSTFDLDERALGHGAALFAGMVLSLARSQVEQ